MDCLDREEQKLLKALREQTKEARMRRHLEGTRYVFHSSVCRYDRSHACLNIFP